MPAVAACAANAVLAHATQSFPSWRSAAGKDLALIALLTGATQPATRTIAANPMLEFVAGMARSFTSGRIAEIPKQT